MGVGVGVSFEGGEVDVVGERVAPDEGLLEGNWESVEVAVGVVAVLVLAGAGGEGFGGGGLLGEGEF